MDSSFGNSYAGPVCDTGAVINDNRLVETKYGHAWTKNGNRTTILSPDT